MLIAWVLLTLVLSATLDKVPDDPAVFKQFSVRDAVEGDHHDRATVGDTPVAALTLAAPGAILSPESMLAVEHVPPPAEQPRLLRLATDSSPPYLRS